MKKLLIISFVLISYVVKATVAHAILFAGQSNAWGYGQNATGFTWPGSAPSPSAIGPITGVYLWNPATASFSQYNPGSVTLAYDYNTHYFAWDLKMAIDIYNFTGIPQFVIKLAHGGTAISANNNTPDWYFNEIGGGMRNNCVTQITKAKKWLADNGYDATFTFIGWDQGESDSGLTVSAYTYQKELTYLFKKLRHWVGNEKCWIIVRELTNLASIKTAQDNIAAIDSRVKLIAPAGTGNYATITDGVHFTVNSQWSIGTAAGTICTGLTIP